MAESKIVDNDDRIDRTRYRHDHLNGMKLNKDNAVLTTDKKARRRNITRVW
jgi:hypothetical protein